MESIGFWGNFSSEKRYVVSCVTTAISPKPDKYPNRCTPMGAVFLNFLPAGRFWFWNRNTRPVSIWIWHKITRAVVTPTPNQTWNQPNSTVELLNCQTLNKSMNLYAPDGVIFFFLCRFLSSPYFSLYKPIDKKVPKVNFLSYSIFFFSFLHLFIMNIMQCHGYGAFQEKLNPLSFGYGTLKVIPVRYPLGFGCK